MISKYLSRTCFGAFVCLCVFAGPAKGSAQQFTQYLNVDCSNPSAQYPTISSALAAATDNTSIYVMPGTTCTENVTVGYLKNVAIVTDWMETFNLTGNLTIQSSNTVDIQGMIVTNSSGDGIDVNNSTDVTLTFVSSVKNQGEGLGLASSLVTVSGAGTYSNNGSTGINATANSTLVLSAWGGTIDISGNTNLGLNLDRSVMTDYGATTINNNQAVPDGSYPTGFGINEYGGAKAAMFGIFGPITVSSNTGGGVSLEETSEISLGGDISWAPYLVTIQGNGPLGIAAQYAGDLTLFGGVTVSDHTTAGVSLYGNSQAAIYDSNQILHNATGTDRDRAGIFVDNGSQAYVSTAKIQDNGGPGILGLVHATLDVEGSTFSSNAGGAIVCDGSTALQTDLSSSMLGEANACKVSSDAPSAQLRRSNNLNLNLPDWRSAKARAMKLCQMSARHHLATAPLTK